jgi:hypothetical protein
LQETNIGFVAGSNRGFAAARGSFLVQLDNDAEMGEGALAAVEAAFAHHPEVGSVALSLRFLDRPNVLNSTGLVVYQDGTARDRDFEVAVEDDPPTPCMTAGASGGAAAWRREVIERVGPLAEEFFMYSGDVDMALRAQRAGYACLYVPDAVVFHRFGASVAREPAAWRAELAHRNSARVLVGNFGRFALARGVVAFALRVFTLRVRVGREEARARLRAVGFMLREWRSLGSQRRAIRKLGPDRLVDRWVNAPR